ncbi:polyadenylate-binding protein-interacting protein 7-like [Typha angustifolia]|uniref:polyadenylate-binding protein-interacting protein 7-like n=1 Tax=Typha angustifolia TaxID=59011 RepID=UPI003C2EE87D
MSLYIKGSPNNNDSSLHSENKVTKLNPNAAAFVPLTQSTAGNLMDAHATSSSILGSSAKKTLDRSDSSKSDNSDDEARQFWCNQLPDDITPDFTIMEKDEQPSRLLSLAGLSLHDGVETSRFSETAVSRLSSASQDVFPQGTDGLISSERMGYTGSRYCGNNSQAAFLNMVDQQLFDNLHSGNEGNNYNGHYNAGFLENSSTSSEYCDDVVDPLDYLVSQFPGFSSKSLADIYYANGCDLTWTIEILTQLEMQVDGSFNQNLNSSNTAPSFSAGDFPALPMAEAQSGFPKYKTQDVQGSYNGYKSSIISTGTTDYVSAVRKLASQDISSRKTEKRGTEDGRVGSTKVSHDLTRQYSTTSKVALGNKLQSAGNLRAAPIWLETGETVANIYSESRGEARDLARIRNACFEQARQAYLIGNKALAKELSIKGQVYNMQMKAAHGKARETIYRQRNPVASEFQGYGQEQDRLIDLHGLHVTEAIHILKHELGILRRTARSAGQRLQVMICVGTGHHTKGSRTPARLPVAVEQFLLEEGLRYTQPQPGLLQVVI